MCGMPFKISSLSLSEGDREAELGLPFSPLCDRKSTLVAESQIGTSHETLSKTCFFPSVLFSLIF